jgi:type II secretory pathway component PulC
MFRRSTIGLLLLVLTGATFSTGCGTVSSDMSRRGGHITLAPGDAEADLYVIEREAWNDAYARGPSWLIRQVRVRPVLRKGGFFGFQILSLFPGRPVGQPLALRVGDIIRAVNGQTIERPGHFMRLWEESRFATSLRVQIIRDRRQLEITWAVGHEGPAPAPRAASMTTVPPYPLPSSRNR